MQRSSSEKARESKFCGQPPWKMSWTKKTRSLSRTVSCVLMTSHNQLSFGWSTRTWTLFLFFPLRYQQSTLYITNKSSKVRNNNMKNFLVFKSLPLNLLLLFYSPRKCYEKHLFVVGIFCSCITLYCQNEICRHDEVAQILTPPSTRLKTLL